MAESRPILKVYGLIYKDGKIVMIHRHNDDRYNGGCGLPGGHVEKEESPAIALSREVKEEIGLEILEPRLFHTLYRKKSDGEERIYMFFIASEWNGEPENGEPEKAIRLEWADIKNLPENTVFLIRHAINQINCSEPYSEIYF